MNQENRQPLKPKDAVRPVSKSLDKTYGTLMPKTIREIAEIQERGRKMPAKKRAPRYDPIAVQTPKPLTEEEKKEEARQRKKEIEDCSKLIDYSSYYYDEIYEYRHVVIPKRLVRWLPRRGLLSEAECLELGITQSTGWVHYMVHAPEPNILLFKRERDYIKKHGLGNLHARGETEQAQPSKIQTAQVQTTQVETTQLNTRQVQLTREKPLQSSADLAPIASETAPPIRQSSRLTRSSTTTEKIIK